MGKGMRVNFGAIGLGQVLEWEKKRAEQEILAEDLQFQVRMKEFRNRRDKLDYVPPKPGDWFSPEFPQGVVSPHEVGIYPVNLPQNAMFHDQYQYGSEQEASFYPGGQQEMIHSPELYQLQQQQQLQQQPIQLMTAPAQERHTEKLYANNPQLQDYALQEEFSKVHDDIDALEQEIRYRTQILANELSRQRFYAEETADTVQKLCERSEGYMDELSPQNYYMYANQQ